MIKRFMPRTFLGRSVMIIVTPLILVQVVSTWVFYDRHWDTVTKRLANAVAGEISMVMFAMDKIPGPANRPTILNAASYAGLKIKYSKDAILPNIAPEIGNGILDQRLSKALTERVARPFHMDSWSDAQNVKIRVQLRSGILDVAVSRERLFSSTTYIFVMWMVGTSMVMFAIASMFMRNQVRPIRRLAIAAESFGKGRDSPDIKPEGATEIRIAATAFNLMRERIQRTISQRTEMLAGVSHDLRTPLTRMKLELAMLGDGKEIGDLKSDVAQMETMVDEYLAFARGDSTEAVIMRDIGAIVLEVATGARREGADIAISQEGDLSVPVRPDAFRRCITNLVGNAMRYADHVTIHSHRDDDAIEILIDDDGPGIPPEEREQVFQPFYRLDSSRNLETGGTGLGLTIAKDVIRSHGGELRLEESPAGGVRARLRLPV